MQRNATLDARCYSQAQLHVAHPGFAGLLKCALAMQNYKHGVTKPNLLAARAGPVNMKKIKLA